MKPMVTSGARASVKTAALCAAGLAATIFAARFSRAVIDRVRYGTWGARFLIPIALFATICAVVWLVFVGVCLVFDSRRVSSISIEPAAAGGHIPPQVRGWLRTLITAVVAALSLSSALWLALEANDFLFYSRMLPWVRPLIWLQEPGFRNAWRFFPCQAEGFSTGCEIYKVLPAFLFADAVAYFPFLVLGLFVYRRSERLRRLWPRILRPVIRWGAVFGFCGLFASLFLELLSLVCIRQNTTGMGLGRGGLFWMVRLESRP